MCLFFYLGRDSQQYELEARHDTVRARMLARKNSVQKSSGSTGEGRMEAVVIRF